MAEYHLQNDLLTNEPFDTFEQLVEDSSQFIDPLLDDAPVVAQRLATIIEGERAHRFRFEVTNMELVIKARHAIELKPEGVSAAEVALDALHAYLIERFKTAEQLHRNLGHKGIGLTIGYIEQNGSWDRIKPLDDTFRHFPESELLKQKGFTFVETYGSKDDARLAYGLKMHPSSRGKSLVGIRKRAAADITDGSVRYDLFKRSAFWIDPFMLDDKSMALASKLIDSRHGSSPSDVESEIEFGSRVIEPYVKDEGGIRKTAGVLPATSSYTALRRFD